MKGFGVYETKLGFFRIGYEEEVIISIEKLFQEEKMNVGRKTEVSDMAFRQLEEYFARKRRCFDFPYKLIGTEFQKKVWKALSEVSYGQTTSYKEIAKAIGNEKACRAVGMANHKNPLLIVIPCHRVIGANGKLVGYAGGLDMKKYLLDIENKGGVLD